MAETDVVMPQLHMPLQSGSNAILKSMRRSYRRDKFLGIVERVRAAIPEAAITTDIIVGFPGETESDFQDTLDMVAEARFAQAYTFQYSIRPGTPAATMPDQIPKEVVQERFERLMAAQDAMSWELNKGLVGSTVEVLVTESTGRKGHATDRLSGRARDGRLVHFALPDGAEEPRPGDVVTSVVTEAKPYFLLADGPAETFSLRRTRAGDAWDRWQAESCGAPVAGAGPVGVSLGMPTLKTSPISP
jgi:tRNA-2-methylthio-N6-dimethylallyladenosine synthase